MIRRFTSKEDVFEIAYRISKDSDYAKEYARYERDEERRLELCEKFAKEKGITGSKFAIAGDGSVNMPFNSVKARILPPLRWGMNRLLVTVLTHN